MTHIEIQHITYLAAFESFRDDPALYAMVLTPNLDPTDQRMYHPFKVRLPFPKGESRDAGSAKAIRYALDYVNPYEPRVIRHSLPMTPDVDLSFYKKLTLESVDREENPAWFELIKAARAIRAV